MRRLGIVIATVLSLGPGACNLVVDNPNQAETGDLLGNPTDFEALLGSTYLRLHFALYGTSEGVRAMATVMSFEAFSNLNNGGMAQVVGIPRPPLNNGVASPLSAMNRRLYYTGSEAARTASNALARLNHPGFTLGSPARDARARAFAEFVRGLSLGYIALMYDSASILHPGLDDQDPGELRGYQDVMAGALEALQAAIDAASLGAPGTDGFPLPGAWLPSAQSFTATEFIRLVRSYQARLRANLARTPDERAAVDWEAVIADAENGITSDHTLTTNTTIGPDNFWVDVWNNYGSFHQMTPFVVGMADISGSYAGWIAAPLDQRGTDQNTPLIITPDLRFPQGATREAQQADFALPCDPAPCKRYFRNRAAQDVFQGQSWGWSNYDHVRFSPWDQLPGLVGEFPFLTLDELNFLKAEGLFRKGDYAAAAALINLTRTRSGLPPLTDFDPTSPVPGGDACVPRVPIGPNYDVLACGNMLEALKYEKRLETQFTHYAAWFLDMRGWGDLPEGTGLHWAPPWEDLLARGYPRSSAYSTGGFGTGNTGTATRGTYGW